LIYTIGYEQRTVPQLIETLKQHGVQYLIDVRSRPYGRKREFNKNALAPELENNRIHYLWMGDRLGGFGTIRERDILCLSSWQKGKTVCLMCMEADHTQCHRDYEIARRLKRYGVNAIHL